MELYKSGKLLLVVAKPGIVAVQTPFYSLQFLGLLILGHWC